MAVEILKPNADDTKAWGPTVGDHFSLIDEYPTHDADTTYIVASGLAAGLDILDLEATALTDETISKVEVFVVSRNVQTTYTPGLKLGANSSAGSAVSQGPHYAADTQEISRPGGGSWAVSDLNSLQLTLQSSTPGKSSYVRVTQAYVIVTYAAAENHPAPTSPTCDGLATQTNAAENATFSAIFNGTVGTETADEVYIEVSESASFASTVWDSGWTAIANCADEARCAEVSYNGSLLSSAVSPYYYRIKFRDTAEVESVWSATGQFTGIYRPWHNTAYRSRKVLFWDPDHEGVPAGYTQKFNFKTGNRQIVATNGYFNESVQASGGFQYAEHGNRGHFAWLANFDDDNKPAVYINTKDLTTGEWGTPQKVYSVFSLWDTHYFPVICIDNDGYIHIFFDCHYSQLHYLRSKYVNETGALAADNHDTVMFLNPYNDSSAPQNITGATAATYPVAFTTKSGRTYVMFRQGGSSTSYQYRFSYTDNNGSSWSGAWIFLNDTFYYSSLYTHRRVYLYGLRYDRSNDVLHISWTHNHVLPDKAEWERGIWYSYSIFDQTRTGSADVGFNVFRKANGDESGYVDSANTGADAIDFVPADAIRQGYTYDPDNGQLGADTLGIIFSETLALSKTGQPIIFWEQKFWLGSPTEETNLCCAKWSADVGGAGSWAITDISDDVNLMLRVRRSSIAVMADKDGTLLLLMPVNALTYHHCLPTGDHDDIDTTSTEATNREAVDDGFTNFDGDTSYIEIAADGRASFTHSETIPTDYVIKKVHVHAICRVTGSSTDIRGYINNGAAIHYGADVTISDTDWVEFDKEWAVSPWTSSAWAASELNGTFRFGIHNNGANTVRITAVYLRVYYTRAADDTKVNTELWLLSSTDDGATWTRQEKSRNSFVGVPIMGHKHELTNDRVTFIFGTGHYLFEWTDVPYGKVGFDARDLRIYYNATEIDRTIDFPDLDNTEVRFKVQAEIAAAKKAAAADHILYFSNPNETTAAKSDPDEVMILSDNMEKYDEDDVLGTDFTTWTLEAGSGTVYQSPPDHANKVFDGQKALYVTAATAISRTIGSALTDIMVRMACWCESGTGKMYVEAEDSSGNRFGAGFNFLTNKPGYHYNDSWTDHATLRTGYKHYFIVGIQITADGCSAWIEGQGDGSRHYIVREASGITTVDDIRLELTSGTGYFDGVEVYKALEHSDTIITNYADLDPDPDMVYHADQSATYSSADALVETVGDRVNGLTVELGVNFELDSGKRAYFRVRVSGPTYDPDNILADELTSILCASSDTWYYDDVVITDLPLTALTVKVDLYSHDAVMQDPIGRVNKLTETDWIPEPYLDIQVEEVRGMYIGGTIEGPGSFVTLIGGKISGYHTQARRRIPIDFSQNDQLGKPVPIDFSQNNQLGKPVPLDYTEGVSRGTFLPVSFVNALLAGKVFPIDYVERLLSGRLLPTAYAGPVNIGKLVPIDFTEGGEFGNGLPLDHTEAQVVHRRVPIEHLQETDHRKRIPIDYAVLTEAGKRVPLDNTGAIVTGRKVPVDNTESSIVGRRIPVDMTEAVTVGKGVPVDNTGGVDIGKGIPVDFAEAMEAGKRIPIDFLKHLNSGHKTPIGWTEAVEVGKRVPVSFKGTISFARQLPIDYTQADIFGKDIPVGYALSLLTGRVLPVGHGVTASIGRQLPVGNTGGALIGKNTPVSWAEQLIRGASVPLDFTEQVTTLRDLPLDFTEGLYLGRRVPTDWTGGVIYGRSLPIDYTGRIEVVRDLPAEWGVFGEFGRSLPAAWALFLSAGKLIPAAWTGGVAVEIGKRLPIGWGTSMEAKRQTPIDWSQFNSFSKNTPIDFAGYLASLRDMPVAWTAGVTLNVGRKLPIGWGTTIETGHELPVDWFRDRTFGKVIPVDYATHADIGRRLPTGWVGGVELAIGRNLPLDWTEGIESGRGLPVSIAVTMESGRSLPLDHAGHIEAGSALPIDNTEAREAGNIIPVSYTSGLHHTVNVPVSYTVTLEAGKDIPVDIASALMAGHKLPLAWLGTIELLLGKNLPIDWTGSPTIGKRAPVDYTGGSELSKITPIDWAAMAAARRRLPIDFAAGIEFGKDLPAAWYSQVAFGKDLPAGWKSQFETGRRLPVDHAEHYEVGGQRLPLEWLQTLAAGRDLPFDWLGILFTSICLDNPELTLTALVDLLLTRPELKSAILTRSKVDDPELSRPEADDPDLTTPDVTDGKLEGGSGGCQNS